MLYYIFAPLIRHFAGFNVFRYITFRSIYAMITALVISFIFGPAVIRFLRRINVSQIREYVPETHLKKTGTPSMGGLLILLAIIVSTLLWADIRNTYVIISLVTVVWLGILGFADDYLKVRKQNSDGVIARYKLIAQGSLGLLVGTYLYLFPGNEALKGFITIPFMKDMFIDLGIFYIPFVMLVIMGASNAVNLTDGLDGLAIGNVSLAIAAYGAIAYVTGHAEFAAYLNIPYMPGTGELTVFAMAILGAGLGFLWFNSHPASVFMGDVGSLSLGGALAIIAILLKREILLVIIGGVFVMEAVSVLLQIVYFKWTKGKRLFKRAPIHHHFELKGWAETKVTIRFWILGIMLALLGLSTLKLQ